jgi:hypothetical protein
MDSVGYFRELKRRSVFRVAAVYALVAWVLVQVSATAFPYLGLPDWTVTLVIVLSLLFFPLALVLAWAFDLTPEGVRRATPAPGDTDADHPVAYQASAGPDHEPCDDRLTCRAASRSASRAALAPPTLLIRPAPGPGSPAGGRRGACPGAVAR